MASSTTPTETIGLRRAHLSGPPHERGPVRARPRAAPTRTCLGLLLPAFVVAALLATGLVAVASPAAADRIEPPAYRRPVDAPVVDPFRPPSTPYGSGNRGLTYDLDPGTDVRAAGAGTVVFAGSVGGTRAVTILHLDGLRTSYSFLDSVGVRRGDDVDVGDTIGTGGAGFHFGLRWSTTYLDPESLFVTYSVSVRLVPHAEDPPPDLGTAAERDAAGDLVRETSRWRRAMKWLGDRQRDLYAGTEAIHGAIDGLVVDGSLWLLDVVGEQGEAWAEALLARLHMYRQLGNVPGFAIGVLRFAAAQRAGNEDCTTPGEFPDVGTASDDATVVLVGGFGSTSDEAAIHDLDVAALGYDPENVVGYSYAGGRTPTPSGVTLDEGLAAIPPLDYGTADTVGDLRAEAAQFADFVESVAAARPGRPVDVHAHSMGGLVLRLALIELERRGSLDVLGTVVTLGTPHRGADIATVAGGVHGTNGADRLAGTMAGAGIDIDPRWPAVRQMSETSEVILALRRDGVPDGVDFHTIAGRFDVVVTTDHSAVDGVPLVVVSPDGIDDHSELPGDDETTREITLAKEGFAPLCRSRLSHLADALAAKSASWVENFLGSGIALSFG